MLILLILSFFERIRTGIVDGLLVERLIPSSARIQRINEGKNFSSLSSLLFMFFWARNFVEVGFTPETLTILVVETPLFFVENNE